MFLVEHPTLSRMDGHSNWKVLWSKRCINYKLRRDIDTVCTMRCDCTNVLCIKIFIWLKIALDEKLMNSGFIAGTPVSIFIFIFWCPSMPARNEIPNVLTLFILFGCCLILEVNSSGPSRCFICIFIVKRGLVKFIVFQAIRLVFSLLPKVSYFFRVIG